MNYIKITSSILTVVMAVNTFIFILPIMANAQAIEKQAFEYTQLSEFQKREIEKLQKEAKLAIYKEINLSSVEVKFLDKYEDRMDTFNQAIDKYVDYNKTNGNAKVNVVGIYQNLGPIAKETTLSRRDVLTLKDIALKMVRNYNKKLDETKLASIPVKKIPQLNKDSTNIQETIEVNIEKKILDRGFEINTQGKLGSNDTKSYGPACGIWVWPSIYINWWSVNITLYLNDCAVQTVLRSYNGASIVTGSVATACGVYAWWTGVGTACATLVGGLTGVLVANSYFIDNVYWWSCNSKGGVRLYFRNFQFINASCN